MLHDSGNIDAGVTWHGGIIAGDRGVVSKVTTFLLPPRIPWKILISELPLKLKFIDNIYLIIILVLEVKSLQRRKLWQKEKSL
jgi:hypothetical protein